MYSTNKSCTNPLSNDKFLDWSKLKAFAEYKINVIEKQKSFWELVENIVGKEENAGLPAFSSFPTMFSKSFFLRVVRSWDCVVKC